MKAATVKDLSEAVATFEGVSQPGDVFYAWRTVATWYFDQEGAGYPAEADEVYRLERVK